MILPRILCFDLDCTAFVRFSEIDEILPVVITFESSAVAYDPQKMFGAG